MRIKITYTTNGNSPAERVLEVKNYASETIEAEIDKLVEDPQEPLAFVDKIELLD